MIPVPPARGVSGVASGSRRRRPLWETVRSGDPQWAHQFLARAYADHSVALSGDKAGFQFGTGWYGAMTGSASRASATRWRWMPRLTRWGWCWPGSCTAAGWVCEWATSTTSTGRVSCFFTRPGRPVRVSWSRLSLTVVRFEPRALASYAALIVTAGSSGPGAKPPGPGSSLVPDWRSLFLGWRPVSAGMARYCRATVLHVLTAVLADPELAEDPVVLDAAYRQLASPGRPPSRTPPPRPSRRRGRCR